MIERLEERIDTILTLCQSANDLIGKWGTEEQKAADAAFWNALLALDTEAGSGLQPGRLVKFAVADNYARYIVRKVGKKTCKLVHIPYMDAYSSPAVNNRGETWTEEIEARLGFEDTLRKLFSEHQQKKMTVAAE